MDRREPTIASPFCLGTFGPGWLMSGSCFDRFMSSNVFNLYVTSKAEQCATERLPGTIANVLCGVPCYDEKTASVDGWFKDYPNVMVSTSSDPSNLESSRYFLKKWGSRIDGQRDGGKSPCRSGLIY